VSRCKSLIAIAAILLIATVLAAAALPERAEATTLKGKLRAAKRALRHSSHRLKTARTALAVAVAQSGLASPGDPVATPSPSPSPDAVPATPSPSPSPSPDAAPITPSVAQLEARVAKARRAVRMWKQRVRRLERRYRRQRQMADWERRGEWKPIIEIAAAKYHVKADGIYRIMLRESGGRRYAGSGTAFKGLFQYWTGTWAASWNPWRHDSIYDGSSQIFATCYAVSRGMGPRMWTTTFASQY
jgi:soluble lytic murein transglycosylase-like protein